MTTIYCRYTSSRITQYTFSCIKKCLLSLYKKLYNDNKHFNYTSPRISCYTRRCIIKMFVVII